MGEIMKIIRLAAIAILIFAFVMGCKTGNYAKLKNQSRADSRVTQQKLIDNWSDYHIWFRSAVIVFDPKDDDKKILVGSNWGTVNDKETWADMIKANTTSHGNISPVGASYSMTGVREIWSRDSQFYGYVIHQQGDLVSVRVVDENTMRLFYNRARFGGP
jgi:hypothetical protein